MRGFAVATAALALVAAGCGSSGGGSGGTSASPPPRKIELTETAKGRTVTASPQQIIEVRLGSSYWQFRHVTGGVISPGKFDSLPGHGPVGDTGAVVATFRALKAGTAHITASRTSCGEALRCVGDRSMFSLTVVVR